MARYTGPKCRLCRREGMKLYLKGMRCESEKCGVQKRSYAPGQHGNARVKRSDREYGTQLREKQRVKRIYGVLEKQFRLYVDKALNAKGVSAELLMQQLETRLDNMVYRSGFAVSRAQARQLVRSGIFTVNGQKLNIPSAAVKVGDVIKPESFDKVHLREGFALPVWLEANVAERFVKLAKLPGLDQVSDGLNIQLIIEFYSR